MRQPTEATESNTYDCLQSSWGVPAKRAASHRLSWHGHVGVFVKLTQPRVQHKQCHLVALLCTGDRDKTLVAVVLRLVDLDHTAAELADLVDLCTTLSDDCSDHVVRDENLLGQRLAGHGLDWLLWWTRVARSWLRSVSDVRRRLVWTGSGIRLAW